MRRIYSQYFKYILAWIVFTGGCASLPPRERVIKPGEVFLKAFCAKENISCQWDHVMESVSIKWADVPVRFLVGSSLIVVRKETLMLSAPVRIEDSAIILPPDFERKVFEQIQTKPPAAPPAGEYAIKKIGRVVIDAGHGGKDPGAIGVSGVYEKTIVLKLAQQLKKILENSGLSVVMTRVDDEFIPLSERSEIASRSNNDIFVSVHANSHPSAKVYGVEVYSLRDLERSDLNEEQRIKNEGLYFKSLGVNDSDAVLKDILTDLVYTSKQSESKILAAFIANSVSAKAETANIGNKESKFFVLRNTLIPAVLVEVGFLTNAREERLLRTHEYQQKVAQGIAEGIMSYANFQ